MKLLTMLIYQALALLLLLGCRNSENQHEVKLILLSTEPSSLRPVKVYLDGKDMGNDEAAYSKLEPADFAKGSEIRVDLTDELSRRWEPFYIPSFCRSNFLHAWIMKGFRLKFYASGKTLNFHTLAFVNPLNKDSIGEHGLHVVYNDPYTVWVADGEIFPNAKEAVSAMKKWDWPRDSLALILFPKPETEDLLDSYNAGGTDSIINNFVRYLLAEKDVRVCSIGFGLASAGLPP
jgi:hypothetical protein